MVCKELKADIIIICCIYLMNVIAMNKFHEKLEDKKLLSLEDIRELPDCDTKNVRITARRYEKILILLGNA